MGQLCILDSSGDTKVIWSENDPDSIAAAKAMFDSLIAKGHVAYSVGEEGKPASIVKAFDPKLEKLILRPLAKGG